MKKTIFTVALLAVVVLAGCKKEQKGTEPKPIDEKNVFQSGKITYFCEMDSETAKYFEVFAVLGKDTVKCSSNWEQEKVYTSNEVNSRFLIKPLATADFASIPDTIVWKIEAGARDAKAQFSGLQEQSAVFMCSDKGVNTAVWHKFVLLPVVFMCLDKGVNTAQVSLIRKDNKICTKDDSGLLTPIEILQIIADDVNINNSIEGGQFVYDANEKRAVVSCAAISISHQMD